MAMLPDLSSVGRAGGGWIPLGRCADFLCSSGFMTELLSSLVDSVSWSEANEFCLRASRALGTRVRLPPADEFRITVGGAGEGGV